MSDTTEEQNQRRIFARTAGLKADIRARSFPGYEQSADQSTEALGCVSSLC